MCSEMDDPTTFDAPVPSHPRVYVLSGDCGVVGCAYHRSGEHLHNSEPKPSVALAVIGEMLNDAESDLDRQVGPAERFAVGVRISVLREARDEIAKAER